MFAHKWFAAITLFAFLWSPLSVAHGAHDPQASPENTTARSLEDEVIWFARSVDAVPELTKMVEKQFTGGKILDVSFDGQGDTAVFNMKAARDDKIWNIVVDASKREIIRADVLMSKSALGAEDQRKVADFERSQIDLSEAIDIAEHYGAGKAIGAGLQYADGRLVFQVFIVSGGMLKEVSVDPSLETQRRRRSSELPPLRGFH